MKHLLISLSALIATSALAQTNARLTDDNGNNVVRATNLNVTPTADRTVVSLDVVLDSLRVPSNRYRAFTPILVSADSTKVTRLKTLIVSGRVQDIIFERDGIDDAYRQNYVKVRRDNGELQTFNYTDAVVSEPWHQDATVKLEADLCGCGDLLKNKLYTLAKLEKPDPWKLIELANQEPDTYKPMRELHGSAYITFVVDRWEVKPDYMNNHRELRKITDTLDVMVADPNVSVRQVKIHGFASPESPYEHNRMLATNRAKSLTDYVSHLYNLPANVFAPAEATPENWEGLRRAVVEMDEQTLPHRQQILTTIDRVLADISNGTTTKADRDEHSIRDTYPDEYRLLLREVYPTLRRSDYNISFNFSDFTLEQAKEIYKKRPYQLSLRELWDVAQTMEPYSPEYNKVLQQAVNIYPDDPVANLNLANVAIRQKDLLKAETLLERAGDSAEAQNARAVLAILQQRYADAERLLQQAQQKGMDVTKNLNAIKQLR